MTPPVNRANTEKVLVIACGMLAREILAITALAAASIIWELNLAFQEAPDYHFHPDRHPIGHG